MSAEWTAREVNFAGEGRPTIIQIEQRGFMPRCQVFGPKGAPIGDTERKLAAKIVELLNTSGSTIQ